MEAIRLEGIGKRYGIKPVLERVSLRVNLGEIYALAGPNGSGKTTLIRILTGLAYPSQGRAFLLGEDVHRNPRARRLLGAVVEAPPAFYPHLTGRENLRLQAFLAGLRGEERISEVLAQLGLLAVADKKVAAYSLGQRQRLGLASALLARPKVLVLDEPTAGLDPEGVGSVHALLRELAREGVAVFLSTHHLAAVADYAHRVGILGGGRLLEEVALGAREGYRLEVEPLEEAMVFLKALPEVRALRLEGRALILEGDGPLAVAALVRGGYRVLAFQPYRFDLVAYYRERVQYA